MQRINALAITGKNFVLDPRVKGSVDTISPRSMSRALVYEVFLSALRLQGYAAVEDRGVVKIVPEADAKLHLGRAIVPGEKARSTGDQIWTRVFTLKYESAAQLRYVFKLRPGAWLSVLATLLGRMPPDSHAWIVTDELPAFVRTSPRWHD